MVERQRDGERNAQKERDGGRGDKYRGGAPGEGDGKDGGSEKGEKWERGRQTREGEQQRDRWTESKERQMEMRCLDLRDRVHCLIIPKLYT